MPNLVGTGLNQVPSNSMLGGLAYQDPEHASIKDLDLKNLSQINSEIADTAVDVFVYDTRKDSDGGAWRKRTQHTSWYNETLGTATRGTRREFPAVAVIVAESSQLTIYDGDDPDLPMWMVFEANTAVWSSTAKFLSTVTISSVFALNGKLVVSGSHGVPEVDFIDESQINRGRPDLGSTPKIHKNSGTIALRNNGIGQVTASTGSVTINYVTNDVAMTVLPNAPIDDSTGLPVPTIAVATNGGVSVIKDDGTVFDWTETSGPDSTHKVNFRKDNKLGVYTSGTSGATAYPQLYYIDLPSSDISSNYYYNFSALNFERYGGTAWETNATNNLVLKSPGTSPTGHNLTDMADTPNLTYAATNGGLNAIIRPKAINHSTGRAEMLSAAVAYIQKDYNTGYMVGDIKGAFLSDTDTTNVNADTLNAGNAFDGTFASSTGWTAESDWSISGGVATCNGNNNGRFIYPTNDRWSTGSSVVVEVTVTAYTSGTLHVSYATGAATSGTNMTATGTYKFVNNVNGNDLIYLRSESFIGSIDNVKIYYAESDRSVNNKGLIPSGTITKEPVATGADLVGYSGFSTSNYLENRSDYDFGVGASVSMCIIGWFKTTNISTYTYIMSVYDSGTDQVAGLAINASSAGGANPAGTLYTYDSVTNQLSGTTVVNDGQWHCAVGIFDGPTRKIYLDGKLEVSNTFTSYSLDIADTDKLTVGRYAYNDSYNFLGSLALTRISKSIPSVEQIKKIYEDEKHLFQENAKSTLYGSSDAVTALAYDDSTNLLYAGTSSGRSEFQGLRRINNTTTAVTTAISASNGLIAEQ